MAAIVSHLVSGDYILVLPLHSLRSMAAQNFHDGPKQRWPGRSELARVACRHLAKKMLAFPSEAHKDAADGRSHRCALYKFTLFLLLECSSMDGLVTIVQSRHLGRRIYGSR